ncbi:MAG: DUF1573 domain-containing protein [Bacteroidales bacterium]|jgi:hypothetical protein|nr:DUF1573 domain-containing protein [Bacteroidales bacterium]
MKKLILVIFTVLMASIYSHAQSGGDSIVFEKTVHDYGTIVQSGNGETEFVFVNKGTKPLVLNGVSASCGCTSPSWTRTPVLPGKTGSVKVKYNTEILGSFTKTVTVSSNASNSNVILTIRGNVVQKATAQK